jgi:DNA replication protein DnaC
LKKRIRTFDPPDQPMVTKNDSSAPENLELSEGQFEAHFRRLNLAHMRRIYREVAVRAEKESWSYRDFLALLLAEEVARRKQTRLQRCTRSAHFPFFKTIEEFDFTLQPTLRESVIGSYLGLDFVTEGRSLILHGKTGRGKTHLAVAIGYRAIQNGFETLFTTAAELIEDLSNASKKGHLQESLETYTHPHVLVIDEVGYLTYGPDAANVLFHVVNDRNLRKRPMIFTTNKPLTEWGKVLHDEDMAAAILDRVLERGRFIHLGGPSGRTRHLNLEEILPAGTDRARISGIGVPEFPEPTSFTGNRKYAPAQRAVLADFPAGKWPARRLRRSATIPPRATHLRARISSSASLLEPGLGTRGRARRDGFRVWLGRRRKLVCRTSSVQLSLSPPAAETRLRRDARGTVCSNWPAAPLLPIAKA